MQKRSILTREVGTPVRPRHHPHRDGRQAKREDHPDEDDQLVGQADQAEPGRAEINGNHLGPDDLDEDRQDLKQSDDDNGPEHYRRATFICKLATRQLSFVADDFDTRDRHDEFPALGEEFRLLLHDLVPEVPGENEQVIGLVDRNPIR